MLTMGRRETKYVYPALLRLLLLLPFFPRQAGAAGEIAGSVKRENSPAGKQEKSVEPGIASAVREFRYKESSKSGYGEPVFLSRQNPPEKTAVRKFRPRVLNFYQIIISIHQNELNNSLIHQKQLAILLLVIFCEGKKENGYGGCLD